MGDKLRLLRCQQGFRQADMAARLGISKAAYCKLENNLTVITVWRLQQVAAIFGMTAAGLLEFGKAGTPPQHDLDQLRYRLAEREALLQALQRKVVALHAELEPEGCL